MLLTITNWTRFFYFSHIFSALAALAYILCAYFANEAENATVGDFDLKITHTITVIYYVAAGFLIVASVVGFLAQKLANKPSLWIIVLNYRTINFLNYCILMSILSIIEISLAGNALAKVTNKKTAKAALLNQMEEYVTEDSDEGRCWDRLQIKYKCCGIESYKEWQDVPYGRTTLRTPKSCCLPEHSHDIYCSLNVLPEHDEADKLIFTRGCLAPALKRVDALLLILGILGLVLSLVNTTIVSLTCFLVITKKV